MTAIPGTSGPTAQRRPPECRGRVGGGEARAAPGRGRDRAPAGSLCPPGSLAAAAQLSAAGGSAARASPPAFTRPRLCLFPLRRRLLIPARQLQPRLQRRCAKRGRSGAGRRAAERQRTQVRRPRRCPEGALRCTRRAGRAGGAGCRPLR